MSKRVKFFLSCASLFMVLSSFIACNNDSSGDDISVPPVFSDSDDKDKDTDSTVAQGITYLKEKKFDEAYTSFSKAFAADSSNTDAHFWATLLKIASVSTDTATVSLMKDRIGFADYPSTMNALFTDKWFNARYYDDKEGFYLISDSANYDNYDYLRGTISSSSSTSDYCSYYTVHGNYVSYNYGQYTFTPSPTGNCYTHIVRIGNLSYNNLTSMLSLYPGSQVYKMSKHILDSSDFVMLPRIEIPSWASATLGDATSTMGDSAALPSSDEYFTYLALNLIGRNPDGLNSMIAIVLSGPFGTRMDEAFTMIDSLSDSAQLTIPNDLLAVYTEGGDLPDTPVVLNKAELKAFAGSCKVYKSIIEVLSSYNLNYSLAFAQQDFWSDDGSSALDDLYAQDNPIKAGFLTERSASSRIGAKATLMSAIADYTSAINILTANIEKPGYIESMTGGELDSSDVIDTKANLTDSLSLINRLKNALDNGTALYVNPDALDGGSLGDLLTTSGSADLWAFTPSVLYSTDILNPRKLVETTGPSSSPTGIALYGMYSSTDDDDEIDDYVLLSSGRTAVNASGAHYFGSAVKVNWDRIETFIDVPDDERETFIPVYTQRTPFVYSVEDWKPLAWMMGL